MKIKPKIALLSVVVVTCLTPGCGCNVHHPGTGEKIGQIVKLSNGGIFKDTWEGQIIRGGMSSGSGSFGTTPFDFTVENAALVPEIQGYMSNQIEVVIKYRTEFCYSLFRSDSYGHFLTEIHPAKK